MGTTEHIYGELKGGHRYSLDAQACWVTNVRALRTNLRAIKIDRYARNRLEIPSEYWIHVVDRGPIKATKEVPIPRVDVGIDYPNVGYVIHQQLIEGEAEAEPGDSGAACTSEKNGGVLLGMHIAGPREKGHKGVVYMIPAWHLLDRPRYLGDGHDGMWDLVGRP